MNIRNTGHHITRRLRLIACISTLATAFIVALPHVAHAQNVTPPSVPGKLQVPEGNEAFLIGHAFGSQDYVCAASGSGVAFVLTTPEAVLFDNPARASSITSSAPTPSRAARSAPRGKAHGTPASSGANWSMPQPPRRILTLSPRTPSLGFF